MYVYTITHKFTCGVHIYVVKFKSNDMTDKEENRITLKGWGS